MTVLILVHILETLSCSFCLTLSSPNLPLSSSSTQAANCCRSFRLIVDEDDLKWVKIKENYHVLP